jgi:hypothetical protein
MKQWMGDMIRGQARRWPIGAGFYNWRAAALLIWRFLADQRVLQCGGGVTAGVCAPGREWGGLCDAAS